MLNRAALRQICDVLAVRKWLRFIILVQSTIAAHETPDPSDARKHETEPIKEHETHLRAGDGVPNKAHKVLSSKAMVEDLVLINP